MFSSRSRYSKTATYTVFLEDGREVTAVRFPVRSQPQAIGFHKRLDGQRLDHLAAFYLKNPTAFWRICDTNGALSPDALAVRPFIKVPSK